MKMKLIRTLVAALMLSLVMVVATIWIVPNWSVPGDVGTQPVLAQDSDLVCVASLPTVEWLGEGPGTYVLPADYEVFVVKHRPQFWFYIDEGVLNDAGERTVTVSDAQSRVYACSGNCDFQQFLYEPIALGTLVETQRVEMMTIDDDGPEQNNDTRINWWAANDPLVFVERIEDQQMVATLNYEIPFDGSWYFMANDSIGVVLKCIAEPATATPTATVVSTLTATATVTDTATVTATAKTTVTATTTATATATEINTGTATATSTALPATVTESPTAPSTATATMTATETNTSTATATATQTATATATQTATSTATTVPVAQEQGTATATPVLVPSIDITGTTAIDLVSLVAVPHPLGVQVAWETSAEVGTLGFEVWRSTDSMWATAAPITTQMIVGHGGSTYGGTYLYIDTSAESGQRYTYWLVEVLLDHTSHSVGFTHGSAPQFRIDLPLIMR